MSHTVDRTKSQRQNRHRDTGEMKTIHRHGYAIEATQLVCDYVDKLGPDWRIVTLSTPRTIARDLRGSRARRSMGSGDRNDTVHGRGVGELDPRDAERTLLSRVDRPDLLSRKP